MSNNVILTDVNGDQLLPITTSENVFTGEGVTLKETLDNLAGGGSAVVIDKDLSETSENPVQNKVISAKLNEVFQSVSNGKSLIASAITGKGITTDADATFETMANNIDLISGGGALNNVLTVTSNNTDKMTFTSKIALSTDIDNSLLNVDFSYESITRNNDYDFELSGDFSLISSFSIETLPGFFYDESFTSVNVFNFLEFTTADEFICTLNGREYYKMNDGLAIGGYHYRGTYSSEFYNLKDFSNPLLISEIENACYYSASGTSSVENTAIPFTYDKNGKTYYCSDGDVAMDGDINSTNGFGLKLDDIPEIKNAVENGRDFVLAVLDYYYGYI